jgi:hypothetical protein
MRSPQASSDLALEDEYQEIGSRSRAGWAPIDNDPCSMVTSTWVRCACRTSQVGPGSDRAPDGADKQRASLDGHVDVGAIRVLLVAGGTGSRSRVPPGPLVPATCRPRRIAARRLGVVLIAVPVTWPQSGGCRHRPQVTNRKNPSERRVSDGFLQQRRQREDQEATDLVDVLGRHCA